MAQQINDNFRLHAAKLLDDRSGPYDSVADALAGVPEYQREQGLVVVVIVDGEAKEYWWKSGLADHHLVPRFEAGLGDKHFVYEITNQVYVGIQHELAKKPSVTILDTQGKQVFANIEYPDQNTVIIRFSEHFTGHAILN